jgi:hypothetical protein
LYRCTRLLLLPADSTAAIAFRPQLGRKGGGCGKNRAMSLDMQTAELAGAAVRVDPKTDKPHVFFSQMMSVWDLSLVRGAKMLGVGRQSLRTKWKNLGCGSWGERAARSETESAKLAWLQVNADMWKTAKVVQVLCLFLMESPEHYAISTYTAHLLFLLKVVGVVFQPPPLTHTYGLI